MGAPSYHGPLPHAPAYAPKVAHPAPAYAPKVAHPAPAYAPKIAHPAPAYAPKIVHPAPAYAPKPAHPAPTSGYHKETYPDEVSPYTYKYAVADDYTNANFNAEETGDGASTVDGSYSVALPDSRIQHVTYHSNGYDGYVAEVTYEGEAQYPPRPSPVPYHA